MGGLVTLPANPPLEITTLLDPKFSFVLENDPWPFIHVVIPFSIYYYFQAFWFTVVLLALNEWLEIVIATFTDWKIANELATNSFADVINGLIGIAIAHLLLMVTNWNYYAFPLIFTKRTKPGIYVKYAIELVFILCVLVTYNWYFGDGVFALGSICGPLWIPLAVYIVYYFNRNDTWWSKHNKSIKDGTVVSLYRPRSIQRHVKNQTQQYYLFYCAFVVAFLLSFTYRYTHAYIMAVGHGLLSVIFLTIVLVYQSCTRKSKAAATILLRSRDIDKH